jgi:hypothetical protein
MTVGLLFTFKFNLSLKNVLKSYEIKHNTYMLQPTTTTVATLPFLAGRDIMGYRLGKNKGEK